MLFIDSSHAAKFGGDVCREFLEILPGLKPGVWVHVHDIFFPHDYPAEWLIEKRIAFTEQYLLEAFLAFNASFSVQAANYWMTVDYPEVVHTLCPRDCIPAGHLGRGSFWMRREAWSLSGGQSRHGLGHGVRICQCDRSYDRTAGIARSAAGVAGSAVATARRSDRRGWQRRRRRSASCRSGSLGRARVACAPDCGPTTQCRPSASRGDRVVLWRVPAIAR